MKTDLLGRGKEKKKNRHAVSDKTADKADIIVVYGRTTMVLQ